MTVTISGGHIIINGTKTTADYAAGSGYYTDNVSDVFNADTSAAWHTFSAGDSIRLTVSGYSGSCTDASANAMCQLRDMNNAVIFGSGWNAPNGTFDYTFPANRAVRGLFFYLGAGKTAVNAAFDAAFWVNGIQWI